MFGSCSIVWMRLVRLLPNSKTMSWCAVPARHSKVRHHRLALEKQTLMYALHCRPYLTLPHQQQQWVGSQHRLSSVSYNNGDLQKIGAVSCS